MHNDHTAADFAAQEHHERAGHRDNAGLDLAGKFPERIVSKYQGTRLGRQELDAEILEDLEGALRRRSVIDEFRRKLHEIPELQRIVVAIDPATSSEDESNETGIIVAGLGADGDGYVLSDVSGIYAPLEWRAKPSRSIGHGKLTGSLPRSTTAAT